MYDNNRSLQLWGITYFKLTIPVSRSVHCWRKDQIVENYRSQLTVSVFEAVSSSPVNSVSFVYLMVPDVPFMNNRWLSDVNIHLLVSFSPMKFVTFVSFHLIYSRWHSTYSFRQKASFPCISLWLVHVTIRSYCQESSWSNWTSWPWTHLYWKVFRYRLWSDEGVSWPFR